MPIDTISQVITTYPPEKLIIVGQKNLPENIEYIASANGLPRTSTEVNSFVEELNTSIGQINTAITEVDSAKGTAVTKASEASNSATTATNAKNDAEDARDAAIVAKNQAEAIYDNFDDRYLGAKATPPTMDNDGNPLQNGAMYFNATNSLLYVYDSNLTQWINPTVIPTQFSSLSDISLSSLANGDILVYNSTLSKWENQTTETDINFVLNLTGAI